MDYHELLAESLQNLFLNKMRTLLAVLGIVIGIGSVIALISLGQSTQKAISSQIQSLGSNLLTIIPGQVNQGRGVRSGQGGATTLTLEDAKAIESSPMITTVSEVSPEFSRRSQVTTTNSNTNTQIVGATPNYLSIRNFTLNSGNFISSSDLETLNKVAVLGPTTVINLFGEGNNPIGSTVRINNQSFTVIGTTQPKGGSGFQNQDDLIIIPLTIAQKQLFGVSYLSSIALQAKSSLVMADAQNQVGYLLLERHGKSDPQQADFSIFSQQDLLNTATSTTATFTSLLSGVAAISLLVGGIGIMNIMLVTVTERTREIGLKKAIGAPKKIIISQFLLESALLTFGGGILGIILGIATSFLIAHLNSSPFIIAPASILLAFLVSVGIGLLFGAYPAKKASDLAPIEALRYE